MQLVCKPLPTTPRDGREIKYVRIFHPSDCVSGNEFLALPALDVFASISNSSEQVADVYHHQVALDICQVIAGNESGYFTLLKSNSPIPNTSQWLEGSTDYIFHLDSGDTTTPLLWSSPPGNILLSFLSPGNPSQKICRGTYRAPSQLLAQL